MIFSFGRTLLKQLLFVVMLFLYHATKAYSGASIIGELDALYTGSSVLFVAAHPDDENNGLLAYLHHGQHLRTAYLSLTRGEGGQNLIGEEQGREIGLIRTQELLEARKIDGAEQYFTRAYDFGFSKNPEETLRKWQRDSVLSDMVFVIRSFHPDVIICRFPTTGEGGHGHHTASAILTEEAIRLAADPNYPHCRLPAFECKRLLWNAFFPSKNTVPERGFFSLPTGGYHPLLGKSYGELAAESRSKHECQAMGTAADRNYKNEYFKILKGDTTSSLFGNQITGWKKWNAGYISEKIESLRKALDQEKPWLSVPALLQIAGEIEQHPNIDPVWKTYLLEKTNHLSAQLAGLYLHARSNRETIYPGDTIEAELELCLRSPIELKVLKWSSGKQDFLVDQYLTEGVVQKSKYRIPVSEWTLAFNGSLPNHIIQNNMYSGGTSASYTAPLQAAPEFELQAELSGKLIRISVPIQYSYLSKRYGELSSPVLADLPVTADFTAPVAFTTKGKTAQVKVNLHAGKKTDSLQLWLMFPPHWNQKPMLLLFPNLAENENRIPAFSFSVPSVANSGDTLALRWIIRKDTFDTGSKKTDYPHIPGGMHFQKAGCRLLILSEPATKTIGYVPGSGDKIPAILREMGYRVKTIQGQLWNPDSLKQFDAILTGIRAYNTNAELVKGNALLLAYVKNGGLLLQQYNTDYGLLLQQPGPLPFRLSTRRVTEEDSPVKILAPGGKWKNDADVFFSSWIQERGLYFPVNADSAYQQLFRMADSGSESEDQSVLYLPYGKGEYYYCALSLFRQLPAGVPSAFNLLQTMLRRPSKK